MSPTTSIHQDINPTLLERLGRIVYHWSYVEWMEGEFLGYLLSADPGLAHVVTQNISGSTVTDWIRTLVSVRFNSAAEQDQYRELLGRIDTARAERNTYVHGLWTPGSEPALAEVMTIRWDRAEVMRHEVMGPRDLDGFLEEIEQIYRDLVLIGHRLGFHRMKGSPDSHTT